MQDSLGFTESELITILHALDTVMQLSRVLGNRDDYEDARALAIKLATYASEQQQKHIAEEAMEQKQKATVQ
jgi:hypothetical protein